MLNWVKTTAGGLSVLSAGAMIDPTKPQPVAIITHGHADHAISGHKHVIATPQTLDIMAARYGRGFAQAVTPLAYGCLLYTSPSPRDRQKSRMPSSA